MNRHELLHIPPVKASWQEITALVLEAIHDAAHNQNDGSTHRLCCPPRTKCRPPGSRPSHPTGDCASPRNGADPKSP